MTQFLLNDYDDSVKDEISHKAVLDAIDVQTAAAEIDEFVKTEHLSYLGATSRWMEENSIPESMFNKYVPNTIIEKIKM